MTEVAQRIRTVLVVEDNAADAGLVADVLEGATAPPIVLVARSGHAAIEHLRDPDVAVPDVILLDLNLPGYSGLRTLADLKADQALRHIPVIVLTTSKSQDEINRCYALGSAAVLNKPMRLREYREMLAAFERFWFGHVRLPGA